MQLGVNLIPHGDTAATIAVAVAAEQAGFTRCLVYDEGLATHDVYVMCTAIAAATHSIQVGPGITNPYTRHPAQTAAAVASLDAVSSGRALLGIGAGGSLTLDPLGIERTRPLGAVADAIATTRALWAGDSVDVDGQHTCRGARLHGARHDIEIWLAGRGPKMLELGASSCDGVILDFLHPSVLEAAVTRIRAAAGEHRPRLSYSTSIVMNDDDMAAVRPHMTYRLVDTPEEVRAELGLDDKTRTVIRTALGQGLEAAAAHVRDDWVVPFVIAGDAAECARGVRSLAERHGIDEFLLPVFDMADPVDYVRRVGAALNG